MKKGCIVPLIILVILVLGGAAAVFYYVYDKEQSDTVTYDSTQAEMGDVIKKTVAMGSVVPRKEILIKPQISGIIKEIMLEPGQHVNAGDVIARVEVVPNMVNLNNAENRVRRAKISLENAKQDYARNKALIDQGVIAAADFQSFENARSNAQEELNAAQSNLEIVREGAARGSGRASLTMIKSTISGMVLDVPVEEGNSVIEANTFNEGTTIAAVADMDDLIFKGKIDESEVERLQPGMDLILKIAAIEEQKFDASLEYISPKGVDENGAIQFEVRAAVERPDSLFIRAGYSANADVVLDKRMNVLTINEGLVQYEDDKAFVEVKEGDNWEKREVVLGLSDGLKVEVLSGLSDGEALKVWNKPINR